MHWLNFSGALGLRGIASRTKRRAKTGEIVDEDTSLSSTPNTNRPW
jgi:hypothetical protein